MGAAKCKVSKTYTFEAAHSLEHLPPGHKCRNMHGHSYTVEVEMEGILDPRGFVIDYAEIDLIMTPIIGQLDHRNIDIVMNPTPSTAEYLAIWFYARVQDAIMRKGAVHLNDALVIRIWETGKTRVEYAG